MRYNIILASRKRRIGRENGSGMRIVVLRQDWYHLQLYHISASRGFGLSGRYIFLRRIVSCLHTPSLHSICVGHISKSVVLKCCMLFNNRPRSFLSQHSSITFFFSFCLFISAFSASMRPLTWLQSFSSENLQILMLSVMFHLIHLKLSTSLIEISIR